MIVGDEFDFISGVIASHIVFDEVLNNAFVCFVCAGELVPVKQEPVLVCRRTGSCKTGTGTQDKAAATNKLNRLYKGNIVISKATKTHINLSGVSLTKHQEALLSLGIKCHFKPTFDILKKQTELENLYDKLTTMHNKGTITIHPNLKDQLRAKATKQRDFSTSQLLSRDLRSAAKSLKNHPDIIIRRADKSNIFVVLNKNDYKNKLDTILGDTNKFSKINRNPINTLKIEVNKLIAQL